MWVIKYRYIFYLISGLAVLFSLFPIFYYGLNLGIDFKGGTILEVTYPSHSGTLLPAEVDGLKTNLATLNLGQIIVQPSGQNGLILRLRQVDNQVKAQLLEKLKLGEQIPREERFDSIGPALGQELANRGLIAVVIVVLLIIVFIAIAFRHVSRPVSSWKYGVVAVVALLHDITIPTGLFAYLGHVRGAEIDALFLTAIMTTFALSVNDTIVVFDRIRENLRLHRNRPFEETVGVSLNQTYIRSFNTSFTVILALLALYFFGSSSTRDFSLVLTTGMIVGTYSSIFLASPLLVSWHNWATGSKSKAQA